MAAPLTTSSSLDARRTAIDSEAVNAIAANPAFVAGLHLPPIPPSTPPLERREIEAHRRELINRLAWAAARGNDTEFNQIYRSLVPDASDLTMATAYGNTRAQFLEKRGKLLESECIASLDGTDREAAAYWMRQIARNTQERFNIDPMGMQTSTFMFESILQSMAGRIKPGSPGFDRKMEQLMGAAIDAGFPARTAFSIINKAGIAEHNSTSDPQMSLMQSLVHRAYTRASSLFHDCATLYSQDSPTAQMEFNRKFSEFSRLCAGLLPQEFGTSVFERPAGHPAFLDDLLTHMRISAGVVFVP